MTKLAFDGAEDVALLVGEAADTAGLVFEAGLAALLDVSHVPQVPDQNPPSSRPDD